MFGLNDLELNRFVEYQMLTVWKEFKTSNHRQFKKFGSPKEVRANPPRRLVNQVEDWHSLFNYYISRQF